MKKDASCLKAAAPKKPGAYCEDILLSHPGDTALKFRIASLYMRYMAALKDEAFVQKQLERSIRLFEDSTHSTDTETREAAFYTLSGLYMMNGEAGRALDAVEKLPQPDYDARMLKASILRQTGQAEEAEKLHQTCLWGYVRDAGLCLYSLSAEARARGDTEKALALLDAACRLDVLFHGENAPGMHGNYELARAELLALAGKTPAALERRRSLRGKRCYGLPRAGIFAAVFRPALLLRHPGCIG